MRIAVCSDEPYALHAIVIGLLERRGHEVLRFGALTVGAEGAEAWARVTERAAEAVACRACDEGIFFCWTGTGACIAANKVHGIRAALCIDAQTAAAARVWNHANVLCLSNRLCSEDVAKEILDAWFSTAQGDRGVAGVAALDEVEQRQRAKR